MALSTPCRRTQADQANWKKTIETRKRLDRCWSEDIDWNLYPEILKTGCIQVGKALSIPPTAVLASLLGLTGFLLSPSTVQVDGTDWKEPVLIWECVCMPTGSGKSPLCTYIAKLLQDVRVKTGDKSAWQIEDATFEKMGELMSENGSRILGMYDELTTFLTQINLYRGRGVADSHELALFLQLYNGYPWTRNTVTGEANFTMASTNLTLGGFTQPTVARSIIELPANSEKGLSQRFIWTFPKPTYADFETLEPVDTTFSSALVNLLSKQWRPADNKRVFHIAKDCKIFKDTYNQIQHQLRALGGMDELLCGMLSKGKGQCLRIAAAMHVLFQIAGETLGDDVNIEDEISDQALKAAIDFVQTSIQHTAYIAGRSTIAKEVELAECDVRENQLDNPDIAGYTAILPGRKLDISAVIKAKKFKHKGNKPAALEACKRLEEAGIGKLLELGSSRGVAMKYEFKKNPIPESIGEKAKFAEKLAKFGVTLRSYSTSLEQKEITCDPPPPKKPRLEGQGDGSGDSIRISERNTNSPYKRRPNPPDGQENPPDRE